MWFLYYSPHPYIPSYLRVGVPLIFEAGGGGNNKENKYMRVVMCFLYYFPHPHPHI
jgi:hypothetical protein